MKVYYFFHYIADIKFWHWTGYPILCCLCLKGRLQVLQRCKNHQKEQIFRGIILCPDFHLVWLGEQHTKIINPLAREYLKEETGGPGNWEILIKCCKYSIFVQWKKQDVLNVHHLRIFSIELSNAESVSNYATDNTSKKKKKRNQGW